MAGAASAAERVDVTGNHRLGPDAVKSYFRAAVAGRFSDAELDAALKRLYASTLFGDVHIAREGDVIHVRVTENPLLARVAFEGNHTINDKQIKTLLQSQQDGPLSKPLVHDDVERLTAAYRRMGHFNVKVVPKTIRQDDGRIYLVYEIAEGPKVGIGRIDFAGNKAFGTQRLKDVIKTGESNVFSFLLHNDIYDPDKVETDRDLLQRFYHAHGYPEMRVVSAVPVYDAAKKSLVLTFTVDERGLYRVGNVRIESDVKSIDTAALRSLLLTRSGDVFDTDAVEKTASDLSLDLAARGQPFGAAQPQATRHVDTHTVDLVYRIEQGPRIYVERVEIHGNAKTRDNVIRREIGIGEGDAYNSALVKRSEAHLKKLGYFKSVKFSTKPGSAPDRVVLDIDVQEQQTGAFSIAGGYSDTDGWLAQVGVSDSNFLGRGELAKVSVSYGQYSKGFDLGFTEPYILGQPVSVGIDLFAKQTGSSDYQSYSSTIYGASLTVGTPLTDTLALAWRYSIQNQSLALDPSQGISSIPVQQAAAAGAQWVSTIGSGVTYDTLDDEHQPTKGVRLAVNNDVAGFGGDVKFLRNTDDLRYYHKITDDIVGIAHAQTGYITPWGGQTLPLLNGFFGGPQLVRGFAANGFGPRDLTPGTTQDNVGGNAYWATSYELQSPMPFVPQTFGLKAAVFADAGSLWTTGAAGASPALSGALVGNSTAIRSSVGAGLVWDSILGPLRVDYAYPLTKADYDVTQRLHFGYGMF
jgi:outer membrane protein insertion porin family